MTNSCTPNTHRKYLSLCPQAPFSLSIIARNTRSNLKVQSRVFIKLTQSFTWRARSVARERQLRWRYDALVIARRVRTVCAGRRAVERTRGNRERPPQRLRAALCVGLIDRARPLASTQNADLLPCHAMPLSLCTAPKSALVCQHKTVVTAQTSYHNSSALDFGSSIHVTFRVLSEATNVASKQTKNM